MIYIDVFALIVFGLALKPEEVPYAGKWMAENTYFIGMAAALFTVYHLIGAAMGVTHLSGDGRVLLIWVANALVLLLFGCVAAVMLAREPNQLVRLLQSRRSELAIALFAMAVLLVALGLYYR